MGGNELMTGWPFAHHGEEVAGNEPAVADGRPTRRRGGGAGCCRERRLPGAGRQDVSPQLIWARTRYQPGDPWPQARAETQGCSPSGSPAAFQSIGRFSSFKPQFSGGGPVLATVVAAEELRQSAAGALDQGTIALTLGVEDRVPPERPETLVAGDGQDLAGGGNQPQGQLVRVALHANETGSATTGPPLMTFQVCSPAVAIAKASIVLLTKPNTARLSHGLPIEVGFAGCERRSIRCGGSRWVQVALAHLPRRRPC